MRSVYLNIFKDHQHRELVSRVPHPRGINPRLWMAATVFVLLSLLMFLNTDKAYAQASINIKLVAVNSTDEPKKLPVKFYLPKELEPDDIINLGNFKMEYDVDKSLYYIHDEVDFQPKESKTFKIATKDVWKITQEEIDLLKKQLEESLSLLEKTPTYEAAKQREEETIKQIDYIYSKQKDYPNDVGRRIEQYRAYVNQLEEVKKEVFSIDYLEKAAKSQEENKPINKTIKFIIEVKNPSDKEERTVKEKHYLPKEIREENIVDSQGLEFRFDEKKDKGYLAKEETLIPGEVKKYTVVLKDIWNIPVNKTEELRARAKEAMDELANSIYSKSADFLFEKIQRKLDQITTSQSTKSVAKEHIGIFRVNENRYKEAKDDVDKLENMLAIVRAKKLKELEQGKVKNILQKLKALRGLAALSDAIFKKRLSMNTTWKIIITTLLFVGFFTGLHFFVWLKRSAVMGEEQGPKPGESIKEVPKPGSEQKQPA